MSTCQEALEAKAMQLLLAGDDPVLACLRQQCESVLGTRHEYTGIGAYTHFRLAPNTPRINGNPSFAFGDVIADVDGTQDAGGFIVFIENGLLATLETYAYGDSWPVVFKQADLRYTSGKYRNLAALKKVPGWPKDEPEKAERPEKDTKGRERPEKDRHNRTDKDRHNP